MRKTLLQWILLAYCSIIVTSESQTRGLRVVHKLVGGHITLNRDDDVELITSGDGEGKTNNKKKPDQEEKKTLAQQVAEGKYGLIQRELFSKPLKKPGVISYKENNEVPRDTIRNLGGLNKSDIWLSENHLLVIKGGSYPPHSEQNLDEGVWPSIDDYNAPDRQVKLPAYPKVPPPFPVQFKDNGPLLLLGTNATKTLNGTFPSGVRPLYPEENYVPNDETPPFADRNSPNFTTGEAPFPISPFPRPGLDFYDAAKEGPINGSFPLFPFIGPGDLPPLDNVTYDEDDPSIYYPPPYSFYYPSDNSTEVPPGPLVPGIVLPPPPNFFSLLEEKPKTLAPKARKPIFIPITTTPKPSTTTKPRIPVQNNTVPTSIPITIKQPTISNIKKKYPTITILKAITTRIPNINKQTGQPFKVYGPPPNHQTPTRSKTIITTTRVPLKTYFTTTQFEQIPNKPDKYLDEVIVKIPKATTAKPATQFYFYDENIINTTPRIQKIPEYYVPAKQVDIFLKDTPQRDPNIGYYYINDDSRNQYTPKPPRSDTFSIHIARLRDQISNYQSALQNDYYRRPLYQGGPKPVYQYSFEASNYQNQRNQYPHQHYKQPVRHYDVEIQEAVEVTPPTPTYETTRDKYYYSEDVTENPRKLREKPRSRSKPISQYSFEATPNPIFQQLYTKHDEKYIDDVTKEYFTSFGKKLPVATTPIPSYSRPNYNSRTDTSGEHSISLQRDILVNYLRPKPQINPHAEYVDDLRYNTDRQINYQNTPEKSRGQDGSYISYNLPGDEGTHFYFLTPQLPQKREQNGSFLRSNNRQSRRSEYV